MTTMQWHLTIHYISLFCFGSGTAVYFLYWANWAMSLYCCTLFCIISKVWLAGKERMAMTT
jgi:hypothetical protein